MLGWAPGPEGRLAILDLPPERVTGFYVVDTLLAGNFGTFKSALSHLALPAVTLAFVYGGPIFKMVRASMEAALRSDYTIYAEALGLPRRTVLLWAMRNAAPPAVVVTGVVAGYLLGFVLVAAVFTMMVYLIVDLVQFMIDPRVSARVS